MNDERAIVPQSEHRWNVLDEAHRECTRCGLRIFWSAKGHTQGRYLSEGWMTYDYFGVPNELRALATRAGTFGDCVPPPPGETVIIEYTGDPEVYPGCERIMHKPVRIAGHVAVDGAELVDLRELAPACGKRLLFWEVGSTRRHVGWTPCQACEGPRRSPFQLLAAALLVAGAALAEVDKQRKATAKPKGKRHRKKLKR